MLIRRNWRVPGGNSCVLCPCGTFEDISHLFFGCNFSMRIWNYHQVDWDYQSGLLSVFEAKRGFSGPCFVEIIILACWHIWKQRNKMIFEGIRPSFRSWKSGFVTDVALLKYRVKKCTVPLLSSWLDKLL